MNHVEEENSGSGLKLKSILTWRKGSKHEKMGAAGTEKKTHLSRKSCYAEGKGRTQKRGENRL